MKRAILYSLHLLGILIVSVSCLDWSNQPTEFSTKDILGEWKNEQKQRHTDNNSPYNIEYLYFINDSIVEVQLSDKEGIQIIEGRWEKAFSKQITPLKFTITSDVKVAFEINENNSHVLLLDLKKEKNKIYLSNFVKKER